MRRSQNGLLAIVATLSFAIAGAACDNTRRGADQDMHDAREATPGTDDARRTAGEAGRATGAAFQTFDVRTSLMTDDSVDAGDINVDTNHDTRTVVLKGTVPTAAQREAAERIATREAEGYRIDNQLTVRPRS
jgi:predicted small secreted protein